MNKDYKPIIYLFILSSIAGLLLGFSIIHPILNAINKTKVSAENEDVCFRIKLADLEDILKSMEQENQNT